MSKVPEDLYVPLLNRISVRNHRRHVPTRQRLRPSPSNSPSNRAGVYPVGNNTIQSSPHIEASQRPALHHGSAESPVVTGSRNSESGERFTIQDEERNGLEIAEAALGKPEQAGQVPFYTGEQSHLPF